MADNNELNWGYFSSPHNVSCGVPKGSILIETVTFYIVQSSIELNY